MRTFAFYYSVVETKYGKDYCFGKPKRRCRKDDYDHQFSGFTGYAGEDGIGC